MACCEKCGQLNPEGAAFCTACGHPMASPVETAPPPPSPQKENEPPLPPSPPAQTESELTPPPPAPTEEVSPSSPTESDVPQGNQKKKTCLTLAIIGVVVLLALGGTIGYFVYHWATESGLIKSSTSVADNQVTEPVASNETELRSDAMETVFEGGEDADTIYDVVNQQPSFPGGVSALSRYLNENVVYPASIEARSVQGRVIVSFVVELDGSLSDVTVVKSDDPGFDEEAIRVIKNMPRWTPGFNDDEPVRVRYRVPVLFRP